MMNSIKCLLSLLDFLTPVRLQTLLMWINKKTHLSHKFSLCIVSLNSSELAQ